MKLKDVSQHSGAIADKRDGSLIKTMLDPIDNALANMAMNSPGITIGSSSAKKVKIANATMCVVDGKMVLVAAQEVAFTAGDNISAGYINAYFVTVAADGTVALEMGGETLIANGVNGITMPEISAKKAVIGMVNVSTTAAFTAGTTLLSAAAVTDLYYDITAPIGLR